MLFRSTHAADIQHLQRDVDRMMQDITEIKNSLAAINKTLSEAKGGWKVLMFVAGGASAITGVATWVIHNLWGKNA